MKTPNEILKKIFELDKFAVLVNNGEIFSADGVNKYETPSSLIWLINPNELIFDIKKFEKLDNLHNHVFEIKGMWACIIKDKMTGNITAISSIHNEYPWYYTESNASCISNNIFLLSNTTGLKEIDVASFASFLAIDCSVAGYTLVKDILKNFGGDIIITNNKIITLKKADLRYWLGLDDSINDKEILLNKFLEVVNESVDSEKTQVSLTAGSDSRAVLAGVIKSQKSFKIMTGTASTVSQRDIFIPEKISKILNVEHIKVDASKKIGYSVQSMLEDVALITGTEFIPTNWILYHKEYIQGRDELKGVTRLLGYGGEVFKPRKDVSIAYPKKMSFINSIYTDTVMDRVNSLFTHYKNLSEINAKALYHLRGKFQFWEAVNSRTYSRFCHIYNPLSDPEIYAHAFRYLGGVENIQFHRLIYTVLPKKINKIPINVPKSLGYLYKFKRRYLKSNPNYDYYLTPAFLRKEINFDLLNKLISAKEIKKIIDSYEERGVNAGVVHKMHALSLFYKLNN